MHTAQDAYSHTHELPYAAGIWYWHTDISDQQQQARCIVLKITTKGAAGGIFKNTLFTTPLQPILVHTLNIQSMRALVVYNLLGSKSVKHAGCELQPLSDTPNQLVCRRLLIGFLCGMHAIYGGSVTLLAFTIFHGNHSPYSHPT